MALGETAIHTSPPHHYERIWSLHPTRLSSFPVALSLPYTFPVSPFICYYSYCFGSGSIAGSIYCSVYWFWTFLSFCRVYLFSWIRMLTLGFTCPECPSQAQLIRAELSSNGSSESRSESFSKLSSHQIPRCLDIEGTTTAKGLYAKLFYVLTHYAFGGVSAQCVLLALSTPLRPRGRTGVFRRREGPPRKSRLGHPLLPASSCLAFLTVRGASSRRGPPPADPRFLWVRSPFFSLYVILLVAAYLREVSVRGQTDVFSRLRRLVSSRIVLNTTSFLPGCSAEPLSAWAAGRVFLAATAYIFESTAA